jgi:hypothetical protein
LSKYQSIASNCERLPRNLKLEDEIISEITSLDVADAKMFMGHVANGIAHVIVGWEGPALETYQVE